MDVGHPINDPAEGCQASDPYSELGPERAVIVQTYAGSYFKVGYLFEDDFGVTFVYDQLFEGLVDLDLDGVDDATDACPDTDAGAEVGADGCGARDLVCNEVGPADAQARWGAYVSAVQHAVNDLFRGHPSGRVLGYDKAALKKALTDDPC